MLENGKRNSALLKWLGIKTVEQVNQKGGAFFTRAFDRRVHRALTLIGLALFIFVALGMFVNWPSHREAGYMPVQPIEYSHKTHPGTLGIECEYCHSNASKGPNATVPPLSTCMNCHQDVEPKRPDGKLKPGMKILLDHWKQKKPIVWTKVHVLADFVFFDHRRHVAKDIECQQCHGPVETFLHMKRTFALKMRWCLNCHMEKEQVRDSQGGTVIKQKAPVHCATCHR